MDQCDSDLRWAFLKQTSVKRWERAMGSKTWSIPCVVFQSLLKSCNPQTYTDLYVIDSLFVKSVEQSFQIIKLLHDLGLFLRS